MNLEKVFTDFLQRENLVDKKLLLCVSGGVDSRVLLEVAAKAHPKKLLAVFHLDHNLRKESHKDFLFVQKICSKNKIKFYGETLQNLPVKNRESYWRKKRLQLAHKAARDFGAERILTAHHATDLVETMIFRLTKGTGVSGLAPFEIEKKPFWSVSKSEIIQYADTQKLEYQEDKSNTDEQFERNLIRQKILPHLRTITPNLEKVFVTESEIFRETAAFLSAELENHFHARSIPLSAFLQLHPALQKEFLRRIAKKIPSSSDVEDCLLWLQNNPKGNSTKLLGKTKLLIQEKTIFWD
ncbi:tRNA lysidine(34) synthetase TilS [Candidatus Gracilibacteria bacterium]|nr:tRNA lysidine(34) synthetase TilS [Candidatus Gracilibacteria bacterium]MCF7819519.1 tRNA lysidine(34) synthetase TilS [Candidatus Gracilibacteria bacterium]